MKQTILDTLTDTISNFLYYDRKEDEELSGEQLRQAVKDGVITIDEMVEVFRKSLEEEFINQTKIQMTVNEQINRLKADILTLREALEADAITINGVRVGATKKTDKLIRKCIKQKLADLERKENLLKQAIEILDS